jgi:predicted DNA-binding transcriptional regulator YafY
MKPSQLARHLSLIERLQSVRGCTIDQLALDLEVSRRTLFRDLRALEDAGLEVRLDDHRYQLGPHFQLHASKLNDDELQALALAAATSPLAASPDMAARLDQALAKVLARASEEQKARTARVLAALRFRLPDQAEVAGTNGMIRRILAAIADERPIDLTLRTNDIPRTHAAFTPGTLHLDGDDWRLEGRLGDDATPIAVPVREIVEVQPCAK